MNTQSIIYPILAMVGLTIIVWFKLAIGRVLVHTQGNIHPQVAAKEEDAQRIYKDLIHVSDNLENLFELPVLFYVVCILLLYFQMASPVLLFLAWCFTVFRIVHSWIHCTSNRVRYRFQAYAVSSLCLWLLWVLFAFRFFLERFRE